MFRIMLRGIRLTCLALLLTSSLAVAASGEVLPCIDLDLGDTVFSDDFVAKDRQEPLKGLDDLQLDVYCSTTRIDLSTLDNPHEIADTVEQERTQQCKQTTHN